MRWCSSMLRPLVRITSQGHAHADTLSFELSLRGQRVHRQLWNFHLRTGHRIAQYQRSTASHNTVVHRRARSVGGLVRISRRSPRPTFRCQVRSGAPLPKPLTTGYLRLKDPVIHRGGLNFVRRFLTYHRQHCRHAAGMRSDICFHFHPDVAGYRYELDAEPNSRGDRWKLGFQNSTSQFQTIGPPWICWLCR